MTAMRMQSGWISAFVNDVNDDGIVVGVINITGGTLAFRWDGVSDPVVLPTAGGTRCTANGISNQNKIVGTCVFAGVGGQGVIWDNDNVTLLTVPPGAGSQSTSAFDINEDGGVTYITGSGPRAFACGSHTCLGFDAVRW